MGGYQLKQSQSYADEHSAEDGQLKILADRERDEILRAKIYSWDT